MESDRETHWNKYVKHLRLNTSGETLSRGYYLVWLLMLHHMLFRRFADDTQLYISYNPMMYDELENAKHLLIQCIAEIKAWILSHQLKLNNKNTELIVLKSPHNLRVYDNLNLELPGLTLWSTDAVRSLGCYFDIHMQVNRLVASYWSSAYSTPGQQKGKYHQIDSYAIARCNPADKKCIVHFFVKFMVALNVGLVDWKWYFCVAWYYSCEIMIYVKTVPRYICMQM